MRKVSFEQRVRRRRILGGCLLAIGFVLVTAMIIRSYEWRNHNWVNTAIDSSIVWGTGVAVLSIFKRSVDTNVAGYGRLEKRMLVAALIEDLSRDGEGLEEIFADAARTKEFIRRQKHDVKA